MTQTTGLDDQEDDLSIRRILSDSMAAAGKSRDQIAAELSVRIGRTITTSMLNDYTATGKKTARFPASYIPHFCAVTANDSILRYLLSDRLAALVEVGERELAAQQNRIAKDVTLRRLLTFVRDAEGGRF